MSINVDKLVQVVTKTTVTLEEAQQIIGLILTLIPLVEGVVEGLQGADKKSAVMAGVDALLADLGLTQKAAQIKAIVSPLINVIITVFNLKKLWPAANV